MSLTKNQNICRNNKFGYCKFAEKCRYHHIDLLCEEKTCDIFNCEKRHPKLCLYQRDFGRCKFTSFCKYNHGKDKNLESSIEKSRATEEELKEKIKTLEKRVEKLEKAAEEKDRTVELLATNMVKVVETLESLREEKNRVIANTVITDTIYNCVHCDYATDISDNLQTHITVKHHENVLNNSEERYNIFTCDICDTSYNCQDGLTEHNNNMHEYFACDQCDFDGYGLMIMECHTSTSHPHFSCEECGFVGKNKGGLTRHRKAKHENTKVYKCDECDYQSGIDYHVNSHINDFHRADPVGLYEDLQKQENVV